MFGYSDVTNKQILRKLQVDWLKKKSRKIIPQMESVSLLALAHESSSSASSQAYSIHLKDFLI